MYVTAADTYKKRSTYFDGVPGAGGGAGRDDSVIVGKGSARTLRSHLCAVG